MKVKQINEQRAIELLNKRSETGVCVVFDIETAPLPDGHLANVWDDSKLKIPDKPGPFDASEAVPKNWRDPVKIKARLLEKQAEYMKEVSSYPDKVAAIRDEAWAKFKNEAALDAMTGWVCAVGYLFYTETETVSKFLDCEASVYEESTLLENFWEIAKNPATRAMIGHNIKEFDMPFLTQRSWMNGINTNPFDSRGYLDPVYKDTMTAWSCGRRNKYVGLDTICRAAGFKGKTEGVSGDQFYGLLKSDPKKAHEYLGDDVEATIRIASLTGLLDIR